MQVMWLINYNGTSVANAFTMQECRQGSNFDNRTCIVIKKLMIVYSTN